MTFRGRAERAAKNPQKAKGKPKRKDYRNSSPIDARGGE